MVHENKIPLLTVLLWHETPEGSHHDWMLTDPTLQGDGSPEHSLWTARIMPASLEWQKLGSFKLTQVEHHRQAYLTYEGPISGGRGTVKRVDEGTFVPIEWTSERKVIEVRMRDFKGRIQIIRSRESADGQLEATVIVTP
jgi:hypothetical protein